MTPSLLMLNSVAWKVFQLDLLQKVQIRVASAFVAHNRISICSMPVPGLSMNTLHYELEPCSHALSRLRCQHYQGYALELGDSLC